MSLFTQVGFRRATETDFKLAKLYLLSGRRSPESDQQSHAAASLLVLLTSNRIIRLEYLHKRLTGGIGAYERNKAHKDWG